MMALESLFVMLMFMRVGRLKASMVPLQLLMYFIKNSLNILVFVAISVLSGVVIMLKSSDCEANC